MATLFWHATIFEHISFNLSTENIEIKALSPENKYKGDIDNNKSPQNSSETSLRKVEWLERLKSMKAAEQSCFTSALFETNVSIRFRLNLYEKQ